MSTGILAIFAAAAFVIWCVYELVKDVRGTKVPATASSTTTSQQSKWTTRRIFTYVALTPVFLLCLFIVLFFLAGILAPSTCPGNTCTGSLGFGFGLGWIVGLFLLPLCMIVLPLVTGIVLLFRPSVAGKIIGVVLLLCFAYFAWQFRMLWFPIAGIGPSDAETQAKQTQQVADIEFERQAWIQNALRNEESCQKSINELSATTIGLIGNITVSDFSLNSSKIRFLSRGGLNTCLFFIDVHFTKLGTRFHQQVIFDIKKMEFSYDGKPLSLGDPAAYHNELTGRYQELQQSDNWNELVRLFQ